MLNQKVPSFKVKNQDDEWVSSESLIGTAYVLFFYGQDDTPTCTKQVCSADASFEDIKAKGFEIYGVSPDSVKKHQKFKEKKGLNIQLLSDPDKAMMYAFEAYGPKVFMGKNVIGVYRKAYAIDKTGTIIGVENEVTSAIQGEQILALLN